MALKERNLEKISQLIKILEERKLTGIEISEGKTKIKISKVWTSHGGENEFQSQAARHNSPPEQTLELKKQDDYTKHPGAMKSQMVGTCYLSPAPDATNFIKLGDTVQEGQPLLIIEAMKVMNLIKAPRAGKIIHIAVANLTPVEYGQLLVVIE
jgi:acetyl-CoA carboxylase biotin carboxyl carrier protein